MLARVGAVVAALEDALLCAREEDSSLFGGFRVRNISRLELKKFRDFSGFSVAGSEFDNLHPPAFTAYEAGLANKHHHVCQPLQRHPTNFRQFNGEHTTFWRRLNVSPRPRRAQLRRRQHWRVIRLIASGTFLFDCRREPCKSMHYSPAQSASKH